MKRITYTGKLAIGSSGLGSIAMRHVEALYKHKMMGKVYASSLISEDVIMKLFFNQIPQIQHPNYFVGDVIFDNITSLIMEKPTILHTWLNHAYAQLLKYPDATSIINLFSAHPDVQAEMMGGIEEGIDEFTLKRGRAELEMADHILVPSQFVKDSLEDFNLSHKAIVIPFGVDLETFTPADKRDDIFRVIFVGSNWHRKGGHLLLKAWEKLNLHKAELILYGVDENIFNNSLPKNVKVGWADIPQLVKTLQQSSVFCLPALEDGCPLATHEAMACGVPVIISENTGTKQYVTEGEDGFIIKSNDVDAICEKIQYCYDRKANDLQKMGDKARKSIEEWPWERYETMYINFMTKL